MKTKIYGASDDLIEIEGAITDEVNDYSEKPISFECSDGTKGNIIYNEEGNWIFAIKQKGNNFLTLIAAVGDDKKHTHVDAINCTPYSEVLVLDEGIEWIKIKKRKFKS